MLIFHALYFLCLLATSLSRLSFYTKNQKPIYYMNLLSFYLMLLDYIPAKN